MNIILRYAFSAFIGAAGINQTVFADPYPQTDLETAIIQSVNPAITILTIDRNINLGVAGITAIIGAVLSIGNKNMLPTAACLAVAIYNVLRAMQRSSAIKDLEATKKIIHNHLVHLHGYTRSVML